MIRLKRASIREVLLLAFSAACIFSLPSYLHATPANPLDDDADAPAPLIVMADFNLDGIPDMAQVLPAGQSSSSPRVLTVLLGRKDGSFSEPVSAPKLGHDPKAIVGGDFNGDGNPDVIVGDSDGTLTEFLGDGKGNLVSAGEIAHLGSITSIAVGDFNHDGIPDMAISDFRRSSITVLVGSRDGSFQVAWQVAVPVKQSVFRVAVADFNGDGMPDLAVTDEEDDTFQVLLGNGNGTFTYSAAMSNLKDPNSHCAT